MRVVLICLLLTGCMMTPAEYRAAWLEKYPDSPWAEDVRTGTIRVGMSESAMLAAYPELVHIRTWGDRYGKSAVYRKGYFEVWVRNGYVTEWSDR